jgi:multicomponent Na+:H+ antiporter subunit G
MSLMSLVADIFLILGCAAIAIGGLGLLRMPDVYNRLQAGTKTVTMGAMSVLLGIAILHPDWWSKLLVLAGFILFTNPVGSSTVARAARLSGIKPWRVKPEQETD